MIKTLYMKVFMQECVNCTCICCNWWI